MAGGGGTECAERSGGLPRDLCDRAGATDPLLRAVGPGLRQGREAVAVAAAGPVVRTPAGPRLGDVAAARQWLLGSVCGRIARLTPLRGALRRGQASSRITAQRITDLGRQNSLGRNVFV